MLGKQSHLSEVFLMLLLRHFQCLLAIKFGQIWFLFHFQHPYLTGRTKQKQKQKQKQKNKKEYDCFNLSVDHQRDRPFDDIIEGEGLQAWKVKVSGIHAIVCKQEVQRNKLNTVSWLFRTRFSTKDQQLFTMCVKTYQCRHKLLCWLISCTVKIICN